MSEILVRHKSGTIQISVANREGSLETVSDRFSFVNPVSDDHLTELRWYLEQYPDAPYGVYRARGEQTAAEIMPIGERLFHSIFQPPVLNSDAFRSLINRFDIAIWLSSDSSEFLSLPWELLRDPQTGRQFSLTGGGVIRTGAMFVAPPEERFSSPCVRILFIISRPKGTADISYGLVSRPVLQTLQNSRRRFEIEVLRPATFLLLQRQLRIAEQEGRPYSIVHFDGHGSFGAVVKSHDVSSERRGYIHFESEQASDEDPMVSADKLASLLKATGVKLVVFNACESARLDRTTSPEAAVATSLLRVGIPAVVGMAYSVRAITASCFMTSFYRNLFMGASVAGAVLSGRQEVDLQNQKDGLGVTQVQDWFVPVVYAQRNFKFVVDSISASESTVSPDSHVLIGRDAEFYELEQSFKRPGPLLVRGLIGAGKTTLVEAFLSWFRSTRGFPEGTKILRIDLASTISSQTDTEATNVFNQAQHDAQTSRGINRIRAVLVVDRVDAIRNGGRLAQVLKDTIQGILPTPGLKTILISRGPESWLGDNLEQVTLLPLSQLESFSLIEREKSDARCKQELSTEAVHTIINSCFGHPTCLREVFRYFCGHPNAQWPSSWDSDALDSQAFATLASVSPAVSQALDTIPHTDKLILASLGFFDRFLDLTILAFVSLFDYQNYNTAFNDQSSTRYAAMNMPLIPEPVRGVDLDRWVSLVNEVEHRGLAVRLSPTVFMIHPLLPVVLHAYWQKYQSQSSAKDLEIIKRAIITGVNTIAGMVEFSGDMEETKGREYPKELRRRSGTIVYQPIMEKALESAIAGGWVTDAALIYRALSIYIGMRGQQEERDKLAERVRTLVMRRLGRRPRVDEPEHFLYHSTYGLDESFASVESMSVAVREANVVLQQTDTGRLGDEERRERMRAFQTLGAIAANRGEIDEAERLFHQAIDAASGESDHPQLCQTYRSLALCAMDRGSYDSAEQWIERARRVKQNAKLPVPVSHGSLTAVEGIIALKRKDFDKALHLQEQALRDLEDRPNLTSLGAMMHELGIVHEQRDNFEQAEEFFKRALLLKERAQVPEKMASTFHALGMLKLKTGNLEEAESWFQHSLSLVAKTDKRLIVLNYSSLGTVSERRGDLTSAKRWLERARTELENTGYVDELGHVLLRLADVAQLEGNQEEVCHLLEPWVESSEVGGSDDLGHKDRARVLLAKIYVGDERPDKALLMLDVAIPNLVRHSKEHAEEFESHLGYALGLRAGLHALNNRDQWGVRDALASCEISLRVINSQKKACGPIANALRDIGLIFGFAVSHIQKDDHESQRRAVDIMLGWCEVLAVDSTNTPKEDFFAAGLIGITRLLARSGKVDPLVNILSHSVRLLQKGPNNDERAEALARSLYILRNEKMQVTLKQIQNLNPSQFCVVMEKFGHMQDSCRMICEFLTWSASILCRHGSGNYIQVLTNAVEHQSTEDPYVKVQLLQLLFYSIVAYCIEERPNEASQNSENIYCLARSDTRLPVLPVFYSVTGAYVVDALISGSRAGQILDVLDLFIELIEIYAMAEFQWDDMDNSLRQEVQALQESAPSDTNEARFQKANELAALVMKTMDRLQTLEYALVDRVAIVMEPSVQASNLAKVSEYRSRIAQLAFENRSDLRLTEALTWVDQRIIILLTSAREFQTALRLLSELGDNCFCVLVNPNAARGQSQIFCDAASSLFDTISQCNDRKLMTGLKSILERLMMVAPNEKALHDLLSRVCHGVEEQALTSHSKDGFLRSCARYVWRKLTKGRG